MIYDESAHPYYALRHKIVNYRGLASLLSPFATGAICVRFVLRQTAAEVLETYHVLLRGSIMIQ
jgi:hypothetical protein